MKLGIVSRIGEFPEEFWQEEFELARKKKLDHIEVIINYPYFAPVTYTKEQVDKINNLAKKYNLEIILHLLPNQYGLAPEQVKRMFALTYGIKRFLKHEEKLKNQFFNPAALDERVRKFTKEEIIRTYELGKKINAKLITIHVGSFKIFQGLFQSS
jgi:sugar phosphate isomerase/epimerase